jgi:hypothetical protein
MIVKIIRPFFPKLNKLNQVLAEVNHMLRSSTDSYWAHTNEKSIKYRLGPVPTG